MTDQTVTYEAAYLPAVAPEVLPRDQGITVFVHDEPNAGGYPDVTLSGSDRAALERYIFDHWVADGGDREWFAEVKERITEHAPLRTFIANVRGEGLPLIDSPLTEPRTAVGDDGVIVLGGDADAITCAVDAPDLYDAERRIIATWGDTVTIDHMQEQVECAANREVLVHLNVEAPSGDTRTPDEIADAILAALNAGATDDTRDLVIVCALADEV